MRGIAHADTCHTAQSAKESESAAVIFKRRTPKSWALWFWHLIWPQGGWGRAATYVKHRVRRLPDDPYRISRGVACGVFTTFTPFYGFHFVIAAILARAFRGNILAAIMSTFFGNPLTYVPISVAALETGYFLLGREMHMGDYKLGQRFSGAGADLWANFLAIFTDATADWQRLGQFYDDLFLPYMVGGVLPGLLCAFICYKLSAPVISAYQNRRRGRLKAKWNVVKSKKTRKQPSDEAAP